MPKSKWIETDAFVVEELWIKSTDQAQCNECGWIGPVDTAAEIDACILTAGDEVPAGRCPNPACSACLVYLVKEEK